LKSKKVIGRDLIAFIAGGERRK
jgi:hypothetical protein